MFNKKETNGIIFFDVDDTLYNSSKYHDDVRNYIFKLLINNGLETTIEELWKIFWGIYKEVGANASTHYNEILKKFNLDKSKYDELLNIAVINQRRFRDIRLKNYIYKNVEVILRNLKSKNFKLGIISSGIDEKQIDKLELLNILDFFEKDLIFIQLKKDEKLYQNIYNEVSNKFKAKNLWMIGDREDNDIIPAKNIGFYTIRIKGDGKYNLDFKKTIAKYEFEELKNIDLNIFL